MLNRLKYNAGITFELPYSSRLYLMNSGFLESTITGQFQIVVEAFITVEKTDNAYRLCQISTNKSKAIFVAGENDLDEVINESNDLNKKIFTISMPKINEVLSNEEMKNFDNFSFREVENALFEVLTSHLKSFMEQAILSESALKKNGNPNSSFNLKRDDLLWGKEVLGTLTAKTEIFYT